MSIFGGGGGGGGGGQPSTTTQYIREAPGIEERKLGLMDIASSLAQKPVNIPQINVQGMGALEQQGITQSGITGVGQPTVGSAVSGVQGAMAPVGASQISQFLNPYQQYVTNEIGRQGQMMAQQVGANAIQAGAFGGGREGVQQAELQGRTLSAMGSSISPI